MKNNSMKKLFFATVIFLSNRSFATDSTSAHIQVNLVVPTIVKATVNCETEYSCLVREVSNNRDGYTAILETDGIVGSYNGKKVIQAGGQVIVTQVNSQSESIDATKCLKFLSKPSYVRITMHLI